MVEIDNFSHFFISKNLIKNINNSCLKNHLTPLDFVHLQVLISLPKMSLWKDQKTIDFPLL
jgi:hypothetical protein